MVVGSFKEIMKRKGLALKLEELKLHLPTTSTIATPSPTLHLDEKFILPFDNAEYDVIAAKELEHVSELGRGAYGCVDKMIHRRSGLVFAVKRIYFNNHLEKSISKELYASMKSGSCKELVRFYGAMFRDGDVWICNEVMDTSLDKFYGLCKDKNLRFPELFIAKTTLSIVNGLKYMKDVMNLIHRDIKPSNILLNKEGDVKICDFGISAQLNMSITKTITAGCRPYMAPEMIVGACESQGVQTDVWSIGITLVEIAYFKHPYTSWLNPFQQLRQVVNEPSPKIDPSLGYSGKLSSLVNLCLLKHYQDRPKYAQLLEHPFLVQAIKDTTFDMSEFITSILRVDEMVNHDFIEHLHIDDK